MEYDFETDPMHQIYLKYAYETAKHKSTDPRTQNGAVLVDHSVGMIATDANRFPNGVNDTLDDRWNNENKYHYVEHAERNTIYRAIRSGFSPENLTLYCPFYACSDCARAIIQTGIKRVVGHKEDMDLMPDRWKTSCSIGHTMMQEAGVRCFFWSGKIGGITIRVDGDEFEP